MKKIVGPKQNVSGNLPEKIHQNRVSASWDIADIEFVWWWVVGGGGLKSFSCHTQLLSWVEVELGLWQYLILQIPGRWPHVNFYAGDFLVFVAISYSLVLPPSNLSFRAVDYSSSTSKGPLSCLLEISHCPCWMSWMKKHKKLEGRVKMTPKLKTKSKNEDYIKNKDNLQKEDNLKIEDNLDLKVISKWRVL